MSGPTRKITDMKAYMQNYNRERRQTCKRAGICIDCGSSDARPKRTKCADCARISSLKRAA